MFCSRVFCYFILICSVSCSLERCNNVQRYITGLSEIECFDIDFEPNEKSDDRGNFNIKLQIDADIEDKILNVSSLGIPWENAFLRMYTYHKPVPLGFCKTYTNIEKTANWYDDCITAPLLSSHSAQILEYKSQKGSENFIKRFLLRIPDIAKKNYIFSYVDFTDSNRLILRAQKLPDEYNVTYYQVKAFKEKDGNTHLIDLRLFAGDEEILFEIFTYNDEGHYYFTTSVISDKCHKESCFKSSTPKVFIDRRAPRLVIGIVGASLILPCVLFIFHLLTRKFKLKEDILQSSNCEKIVIVFKSSFKEHNEVVTALTKLIQRLSKVQVLLDVIDISKTTQKFCDDALKSATCLIYVAPPLHEVDTNFEILAEELKDKEVFTIIFDYCTNNLPSFLQEYKGYYLMDDFDRFVKNFNVNISKDAPICLELKRQIEEAKLETKKHITEDNIPQIVISADEYDSLIPHKIVIV